MPRTKRKYAPRALLNFRLIIIQYHDVKKITSIIYNMITVHYWPGLIPHLSLSITNREKPIYISFYPANDASLVDFTLHTYEEDLKHRPNPPNKTVVIPSIEENGFGLSEHAIVTWFDLAFANQKPGYNVLSHNCSSVVWNALKMGAVNKEIAHAFESYSPAVIDTPDAVFDFASGLTQKIRMVKEQLRRYRENIAQKSLELQKLFTYPIFENFHEQKYQICFELTEEIHHSKFCQNLSVTHRLYNFPTFKDFINELKLIMNSKKFKLSPSAERKEIYAAINNYIRKMKTLNDTFTFAINGIVELKKTYFYLNSLLPIIEKADIENHMHVIREKQTELINSLHETTFMQNVLKRIPRCGGNNFWNSFIDELSTFLKNPVYLSRTEQQLIYHATITHLISILPHIGLIMDNALFVLEEKRQRQEEILSKPSLLNNLLSKAHLSAAACVEFFTYTSNIKANNSYISYVEYPAPQAAEYPFTSFITALK